MTRNVSTFLRYEQYVDALAHLLSTGQGVVLDRSCYSDFVFVEAMTKSNYLSKAARSAYYDIKKNTILELLKPHLVIYLDIPVEQVKVILLIVKIFHRCYLNFLFPFRKTLRNVTLIMKSSPKLLTINI